MSTSINTPITLGLHPTFGFGDRLGLATEGHAKALMQIFPNDQVLGIFAQQSIRELKRTNRTPAEVLASAQLGLTIANCHSPYGADADHIKTSDDLRLMADTGFTFYTIDPSDHVDQFTDQYTPQELDEQFNLISPNIPWWRDYLDQSFKIDPYTTLTFDLPTLKTAIVKYGRAIQHAISLSNLLIDIANESPLPYEIEISIDETPSPTTLHEHFLFVHQLQQQGIKITSLAPRFVGQFEKAIDYLGNIQLFEANVAQHHKIAQYLGPYKLSLHSGSDKLSIYPAFVRATQGHFHIKTAGTSYLEALRVVLHQDLPLFREIIDFARWQYEAERDSYHVSASLSEVQAEEIVKNPMLLEEIYLGRWDQVLVNNGFTSPGRQILHVTFGSVLTHDKYNTAIRCILEKHIHAYTDVLQQHFIRHLQPLRASLPSP